MGGFCPANDFVWVGVVGGGGGFCPRTVFLIASQSV